MGQNNEYSSINQKVIYVKALFYGLGGESERWERKHREEMERENSDGCSAGMNGIFFPIRLHTLLYAICAA